MHLDAAGFDVFNDQLNTEFRVRTGEGNAVAFLLVRVTRGPDSAHFEQYSLLFDGPAAPPLAQATYRFDHPTLGEFDLFIVPVAHRPDARTYEAVLSRPRPVPTPIEQEASRE